MARREGTIWICDAPRCRKAGHEEADGERPPGFYGSVFEVHEAGGSAAVDWYACQVSHIAAAIRGALEAAEDSRRG
jgi:hypothetical protein